MMLIIYVHQQSAGLRLLHTVVSIALALPVQGCQSLRFGRNDHAFWPQLRHYVYVGAKFT